MANSRRTRGKRSNNDKIGIEALQYVKDHRKKLITTFTKGYKESHPKKPLSIFLAGSLGAGKTEYSKSLLTLGGGVQRIDADDIREWLPMHTGSNSDVVQKAASKGVDVLYDYSLDKKMSCIVDATFTPFEVAHCNVQRSLKRGRTVQVHYVYQDPLVAWRFVKKREIVEGRFVPIEAFIYKFFQAHENVCKIKKEFGDYIDLFVVLKDFTAKERQYHAFVSDLESIVTLGYTEIQLRKKLSKIS